MLTTDHCCHHLLADGKLSSR